MTDKARIIELQRQVRIARTALKSIADQVQCCPDATAREALDEMEPLDRKRPLQGLVGHADRKHHAR